MAAGRRFPMAPGIVFRARGARYLIGSIVERDGRARQHGIWDGTEPGPPAERFAVADWDEARIRFEILEEGSRIEVNRDPPACPNCGADTEWMNRADETRGALTGYATLGPIGALIAAADRKRFACPSCATEI
jgi:hypothetical protein